MEKHEFEAQVEESLTKLRANPFMVMIAVRTVALRPEFDEALKNVYLHRHDAPKMYDYLEDQIAAIDNELRQNAEWIVRHREAMTKIAKENNHVV